MSRLVVIVAEGVAAIQEAAELRAAIITLRELVRVHGLSWDEDALYIVEHDLGFPMGTENVEVGRHDA